MITIYKSRFFKKRWQRFFRFWNTDALGIANFYNTCSHGLPPWLDKCLHCNYISMECQGFILCSFSSFCRPTTSL